MQTTLDEVAFCHASATIFVGFPSIESRILFGITERLFVAAGLGYFDIEVEFERNSRSLVSASVEEIEAALASGVLVGCFTDIPSSLYRFASSLKSIVFVRDPLDGIPARHATETFGRLGCDLDALARIVAYAKTMGSLLIMHEDFVRDPANIIASIVRYSNIEVGRAAIDAAIIEASAIGDAIDTDTIRSADTPQNPHAALDAEFQATLTSLLDELKGLQKQKASLAESAALGFRAELDSIKRYMMALAQENHFRIEENAALRQEVEALSRSSDGRNPHRAITPLLAQMDAGALKIAFGFSTRERPEFSIKTIGTIDSHASIDVFWLDGSQGRTAKRLASPDLLSVARLKEVHYHVTGGADAAIRYALRRMLDLGYPFLGLLENDIELDPGWLPALLSAIAAAERDGFTVGAATVRSISSRCVFHRPDYVTLWNMGAGMVLFSREGAEAVLADYHTTNSREVAAFWEQQGFDIEAWELWMDCTNRGLGADWWFAAALLKRGLVAVGTIPSLGKNIDHDIADFRTTYVGKSEAEAFGNETSFRAFRSRFTSVGRLSEVTDAGATRSADIERSVPHRPAE